MRLYLAVAVLMLAFVAYTEAQEATVEERFNQFGEQVKEFTSNTAEQAKAALEKFNNHESVQKMKNWFQQKYDELQAQFA
uniref:Apolipoprotein C-I n=1 Tax=Neogobius melanostomus TaxID=47308 RepID=A0A8C6WN95_9GOBI